MNFTQLKQNLKDGEQYCFPNDIYCIVHIIGNKKAAIARLGEIDAYWKNLGVSTEYEIKPTPPWALNSKVKQSVKIWVDNEKINANAAEMRDWVKHD